MSGIDPARIRALANAVRDSQEPISDDRVSVELSALCALLLAAHDWADTEQARQPRKINRRCPICSDTGWRKVNGFGSVEWEEPCEHGLRDSGSDRQAETTQLAPGEASQSGVSASERIAQPTPPPSPTGEP